MKRLLHIGAWSALVIGILMHLTVRDRFDSLALLFYLLPMPVLIASAAFLALSGKARRTPAIIAIALTAAWFMRSFHLHPAEAPATDEVRVLFWNLGRPQQPFQPLIRMVKELQPDFVACVEPGPNAARDVPAYKAALPGYDCQFMPRGILWLSRPPSRYRARGRLDSIGAYAVFEAQLQGRIQRIVTVDVYADPFLPRTGQLNETLNFAGTDPKVIVMGDFNTPSESAHFDAFRLLMNDALETGATGFRETWFWGLPLLSLDHIWLGKDWHVLEARKLWTLDSDHAAVFVRVR